MTSAELDRLLAFTAEFTGGDCDYPSDAIGNEDAFRKLAEAFPEHRAAIGRLIRKKFATKRAERAKYWWKRREEDRQFELVHPTGSHESAEPIPNDANEFVCFRCKKRFITLFGMGKSLKKFYSPESIEAQVYRRTT